MVRAVGGGSITHLLRATPPEIVRPAAEAFDVHFLGAYERAAGLDPLSAQQAAHCQLPLRLGGRGLRCQAALANAAWVATWAQNLSEVAMRTGLENVLDLASCALPFAVACRQATATLPPPGGAVRP